MSPPTNPSAFSQPDRPVADGDARVLDAINSPADLKKLPPDELPRLAREIRDEIIAVTSRNGGHVGPNLGVVELTIALHRVFDTPKDQIVFDVSHQAYVHKLLTGRRGEFFKKLRHTGGVSGFCNRAESPHDSFGAGHAGTALSAALGMAAARDLNGTGEHVVAVCGDGAFTCGVTMEALNNIITSTKRLIVILNDNEWSIARNVGAISRYLTRLSTSPTYNKIHNDLEKFFTSLPRGQEMHRTWMKWKRETKDFFVESSLFEKYGLRYIGPVNGHDIDELAARLEFAKQSDSPILVHVLTKKGLGLPAAINSPEKFHGASPYDPATGETVKTDAPPAWQEVFGRTLTKFAKADPRIVGITAAMPSGTGLNHLAAELPRQFFDVGIAEEHAVVFAAGLATKNIRPVVAIYSTFLQRSLDPILHDVCLQNLPVTFCMDRAGLSPNDGATHHGLFDIAYLRLVPNAVIMQPKDEDELVDMMHTALTANAPMFIRYPRGAAQGVPVKAEPSALPVGKAEVLREGAHAMIWALGTMVGDALALSDRLALENNLSVGVVNARFAKPLDSELLLAHAAKAPLLVTMEDHVITGGFGGAVLETLQQAGVTTPVECIGWPDAFVEHGTDAATLRAAHGLSPEAMRDRVLRALHSAAP
ncbi:1-deoxy-D-xylulose-5-phosphate synthase [Ereboglobus sp. PH5-10]|uniref:1-deoxy-D-xylulose-5-phosphate synthase n=1 Tax=Ereboglobus sp. PH5-10 TaxID=2940629 RepID=UPI002406F096|nr:1-deoxy-D-xylulose-5-phosphate synthase [Ereboglobus sp. PH5-10]MDF9826186.1 1-deoxy-D-xylulose-5-phosphate synthase [Ereboglobus sp. PH5-10]